MSQGRVQFGLLKDLIQSIQVSKYEENPFRNKQEPPPGGGNARLFTFSKSKQRNV
jgi:hypothetical protein